ncbi:HD domain-containing protein [Geodermatophilus amargosae]|uniref:HD domain-containing protein n=1 Tax=Geodermatophilus amargosae TaxID=1296565 RepID=UPI0034DFA122
MTVSLPALPDTAACRLAREVVQEFSSPALVNHCLRSYLWAADHAARHGIDVDAELLFVSAMVHDLGLTPVFDSATVPFEEAGGAVGWVFAAGAGWPAGRRRRVAEVVVAHMAPEVDVDADPEGHLLELATGLDISGRDPDAWPADLRAEVLARYPRLGLIDEFVACFTDQARRKPDSLAGRFTAAGFAARAQANPLDA